jgi:N-acetylglucosaminyldiphosphoundecaprenol N-acetyl-beta-D-mannosaminyltransferase
VSTRVPFYDLLGVHVSVLNLDLASAEILAMVRVRERAYICVAPVSTIVDARREPCYRAIVNQAALVTPDGMPVVWCGRKKGFSEVQRTYGPDLMLKVCEDGLSSGLRHFFYGATGDVCDKLVRLLKERFPGLIVAGTFSPPYTKEAQAVGAEEFKVIQESRPDILWVGLGSPKQDYWMSLNRSALDVPVMIGIGAAFDFHAGVKPQAPCFMRRTGLEWLFRLICEPRRLWRRYLVGNTLFVWWLLCESFGKQGES